MSTKQLEVMTLKGTHLSLSRAVAGSCHLASGLEGGQLWSRQAWGTGREQGGDTGKLGPPEVMGGRGAPQPWTSDLRPLWPLSG